MVGLPEQPPVPREGPTTTGRDHVGTGFRNPGSRENGPLGGCRNFRKSGQNFRGFSFQTYNFCFWPKLPPWKRFQKRLWKDSGFPLKCPDFLETGFYGIDQKVRGVLEPPGAVPERPPVGSRRRKRLTWSRDILFREYRIPGSPESKIRNPKT